METSNNLLPTPNVFDATGSSLKGKEYKGTAHAEKLEQAINRRSLTCSREASPASLFPKPEEEEVRKMIATYGQICYESYENFIRGGSSVKMLAASLLGTTDWFSNKCNLTWKAKVTKSNRLLFQLQPSALPIAETASGLSLIPKTPSASDAEGGVMEIREGTKGKYKLRDIVPHYTKTGGIGRTTGLKLQPAFVEWMMGYPIGWTDVGSAEIPETQD